MSHWIKITTQFNTFTEVSVKLFKIRDSHNEPWKYKIVLSDGFVLYVDTYQEAIAEFYYFCSETKAMMEVYE